MLKSSNFGSKISPVCTLVLSEENRVTAKIAHVNANEAVNLDVGANVRP